MNVRDLMLQNGCGIITMKSTRFDQARGIDDDTIIQKALEENWILLTNDKDFGEKVFRDSRLHRGVILLRLEDERSASKNKSAIWSSPELSVSFKRLIYRGHRNTGAFCTEAPNLRMMADGLKLDRMYRIIRIFLRCRCFFLNMHLS